MPAAAWRRSNPQEGANVAGTERDHIVDFAEHLIRTRGPLTARMVAVVYREQYHVGDILDVEDVEAALGKDPRLAKGDDGHYAAKTDA